MMQSPLAEELEEERAADRAAARGDIAAAQSLLERATARAPDRSGLWLKLAAMRRAGGNLSAALEAVSGALRADPVNFVALLSRARLLEDSGKPREATQDYMRALAQVPDDDAQIPPAWRRMVEHARRRSADYHAQIGETWQAAIDADPALDARDRARLGRFKTNALRQTRVWHSEPTHYHYPGLAEREVHDREDFRWIGRLEGAAAAITDECAALVEAQHARAEPYIQYAAGTPVRQWSALNHSHDWTAFHLTRGGTVIEENARLCPRTMEALASIPQPRIAGRSPNAMFSLLKPHTRIPPHTGIANTRLVCHLPLIVPDGCWFRVGATRQEWRVGEAFVFDDTIEHEAANDSEEPRVVLIVDVWHPGLNAAERAAVTRVMEADQAEYGQPI